SAPAWMKTSDHLNVGSLKPEEYDIYARYLVRYLQAFEDAGVPIDTITPINEPLFEPGAYLGMYMSADEEASFIADNLGPALEEAGLTTGIFIYDHNWDRPEYPAKILSDPESRQYVAGTAFHCYDGSVAGQLVVHDEFPDTPIMV